MLKTQGITRKVMPFYNAKKLEEIKMEKEKTTQEVETEETTANETAEETAVDVANYMKIRLSKTYKFEGQEIKEIDLNKLEDLTGADMLTINRMMKKRGNIDASPEMTLEFAFYAAMQATGLPLEFFYNLNMKDSMDIKMRVNYFLRY